MVVQILCFFRWDTHFLSNLSKLLIHFAIISFRGSFIMWWDVYLIFPGFRYWGVF